MATVLEDYLNSIGLLPRLGEHKQAIQRDFQQGGFGIPKGVFDALIGTALGLPLEATQNAAKIATGSTLAGLGQVTHGTPLQKAGTEAAYQSYDGAPIQDMLRQVLGTMGLPLTAGPQLASLVTGEAPPSWLPTMLPSPETISSARAANEGAAGVNKYATGLLNMALDPANLITGGAGEVLQAKKATKLWQLKNAGAGLSDEFLTALEEEAAKKAQGLTQAQMAKHNQDLIIAAKKAAPLDTSVATTGAPSSLAEYMDSPMTARLPRIKELYSEALPAAKSATAEAAAALKAQQAVFREAHKKGLREVTATPDTGLPAWLKPLGQQAQGKSIVNPGMPKKGEDFFQFTKAHYQVWNRLQSEEQQLAKELESLVPPDFFETLNAKVADAVPGPRTPENLANLPVEYMNDGTPVVRVGEDLWPTGGPKGPAYVGPEGHIAPDAVLNEEQILKLGGTPATKVGVQQQVQQLAKQQALNGSTPPLEPGYAGIFADLVKAAVQNSWETQQAAMAKKKVGGFSVGEMVSVWKGMVTQTFRNIFMDEAFVRLVLANEGIKGRTYNNAEKWIANRIVQGEKNPAMLLGQTGDRLAAVGIGVGEKNPEKFHAEFIKNLGGNVFDMEVKAAENLSALEYLKYQTLAQVANPLRGGVSLLLAPFGYFAPMRMRLFHIFNSVTHTASRSVAFDQAFLPYLDNSAKQLFAAAANEGKDFSLLAGRGAMDGAEVLSTEGLFSAAEVRKVLGERYATEWQRMVDEAVQAGFTRSKQVFGDYANRSKLEQALNTFMPFMSWTWRSTPRVARMVLEHPAVSTGMLHYYEATNAIGQREGQPGYYTGSIGINQDTPLLGLLAKLFSPEEEATLRLNPLTLFLGINPPAATSAFTEADGGGDKTAYQGAKALAGLVGGQFSPIVQGVAYATGQDYQSPGPLSRYAPIDQAVGTMTGNAFDAPSIAQGPLRAIRKAVTGKQDNYDPVEVVAQRLVMDRTGVPVADTRNKQYAIEIAKKTGVYLEAQKLLDLGNTEGSLLGGGLGGAKRTAFNAVSPVSVQVDSLLSQQGRQAKAGMPFSYEEIQAAQQTNVPLAAAMKEANLQYQLQNPKSAIGMKPDLTKQDMQDPRLTAWEQRPDSIALKRYLPARYAEERKAFMEAAGIY